MQINLKKNRNNTYTKKLPFQVLHTWTTPKKVLQYQKRRPDDGSLNWPLWTFLLEHRKNSRSHLLSRVHLSLQTRSAPLEILPRFCLPRLYPISFSLLPIPLCLSLPSLSSKKIQSTKLQCESFSPKNFLVKATKFTR